MPMATDSRTTSRPATDSIRSRTAPGIGHEPARISPPLRRHRVQHLLAGAGLRQRLVAVDDKAAPVARRRPAAACPAGTGTSRRRRARSAGRSSAATARLGRGRPAAGRRRAYRTGRWCRRRAAGRSSRPAPRSAARRLPCISARPALMPCPRDGADPALLRQQHGDRLALDQRRDRDLDRLRARRRSACGGARAACRRRIPPAFPRPPWRAPATAACRWRAALRARPIRRRAASSSFLIAISSSRRSARSRMFRIASACTSVRLPARHHLGLRVVPLADDADHLVEIEIDDDEAAQHLHAARDRGEPVPAAALQAPRGDGRERPAAPPSGSSRAARRAGRSR